MILQVESLTQGAAYELRGPGIDAEGRRYVFATANRCAAFAEAVNFAYRNGFRDGRKAAIEEARGDLTMVTGATPESLAARPESRIQRFRRRLRNRSL